METDRRKRGRRGGFSERMLRRRLEFSHPSLAVPAIAVLILALSGGACVERRSPVEPIITAHTPEYNLESSADFHGKHVGDRGDAACRTCHGADLDGAAGAPSCYDCHDGPGGHPYGWAHRGATDSHGKAVEEEGPDPCRVCHGEDDLGGWTGVSCYDCHDGPGGHPEGWSDPKSAAFHGSVAFVDSPQGCFGCHGIPPASGTSGVSCASAECHE